MMLDQNTRGGRLRRMSEPRGGSTEEKDGPRLRETGEEVASEEGLGGSGNTDTGGRKYTL